MSVTTTLTALGGVATWAELHRHHRRRAIERALAGAEVERTSRGHYALASIGQRRKLAAAIGGTVSHLSAALEQGWKVKAAPELVDVTVSRTRRVRPEHAFGRRIHHADLSPQDVTHGLTSSLRTVLDCARLLPFDEALTVADSALRARALTRTDLRTEAAAARGPGSRMVRRVAQFADARATGPIESVLRALAIEEGLLLTPQAVFAESGMFAVVDLGDPQLGLALEAEGYESHGTRKGLRRDCRRHTELVAHGYSSLRYAYEDIMFDQEWVRRTLRTWWGNRPGRHVDPDAACSPGPAPRHSNRPGPTAGHSTGPGTPHSNRGQDRQIPA